MKAYKASNLRVPIKKLLIILALVGLSACAPKPPCKTTDCRIERLDKAAEHNNRWWVL